LSKCDALKDLGWTGAGMIGHALKLFWMNGIEAHGNPM
jgi:hypothetical protein